MGVFFSFLLGQAVNEVLFLLMLQVKIIVLSD